MRPAGHLWPSAIRVFFSRCAGCRVGHCDVTLVSLPHADSHTPPHRFQKPRLSLPWLAAGAGPQRLVMLACLCARWEGPHLLRALSALPVLIGTLNGAFSPVFYASHLISGRAAARNQPEVLTFPRVVRRRPLARIAPLLVVEKALGPDWRVYKSECPVEIECRKRALPGFSE